MPRSRIVIATLATVVLVPLAYRYADHFVARVVYGVMSQFLGSGFEVHDDLYRIVVLITAAGVVARFVPPGPPWFAELRTAAILGGVAAPLAFGVKTLLKLLFGRTETRVWLAGLAPDGFHWLPLAPGYGGFPSGHMTVCLAIAAVGWRYFPRLAWLWVGTSLLLPVLLVGTAYHFVSDVIAGAYVAIVLHAALTTPRALAFWRIPPAGGTRGGRSA